MSELSIFITDMPLILDFEVGLFTIIFSYSQLLKKLTRSVKCPNQKNTISNFQVKNVLFVHLYHLHDPNSGFEGGFIHWHFWLWSTVEKANPKRKVF